jgi:type II secretion system protein I
MQNAKLKNSKITPLCPPLLRGKFKGSGFTLLEILVALAILGIAITIVLQLFSANLRAISVSEDYVSAGIKAEARMRELLDDAGLTERSWSEVTDDGYRTTVSVTDMATERTQNLQIRLLEINLAIYWSKGGKERSITLKTNKVVNKQI